MTTSDFIRNGIYATLGIAPSAASGDVNLTGIAVAAFLVLTIIPTRARVLEIGRPPKPLREVGYGPSVVYRASAWFCGVIRGSASVVQKVFMAYALYILFVQLVRLL